MSSNWLYNRVAEDNLQVLVAQSTAKVRCTLSCIGRTASSRLKKATIPLDSHIQEYI